MVTDHEAMLRAQSDNVERDLFGVAPARVNAFEAYIARPDPTPVNARDTDNESFGAWLACIEVGYRAVLERDADRAWRMFQDGIGTPAKLPRELKRYACDNCHSDYAAYNDAEPCPWCAPRK